MIEDMYNRSREDEKDETTDYADYTDFPFFALFFPIFLSSQLLSFPLFVSLRVTSWLKNKKDNKYETKKIENQAQRSKRRY
jgi:hypothetical protein